MLCETFSFFSSTLGLKKPISELVVFILVRIKLPLEIDVLDLESVDHVGAPLKVFNNLIVDQERTRRQYDYRHVSGGSDASSTSGFPAI